MSDTPGLNWKPFVLPVSLTAASFVLLAFIAHALGIIQVQTPWGNDTPAPGGASPSDIATIATQESTSADPSNPTATEAAGTWVAVYENEPLKLDSFLAGTNECFPADIDLDVFNADTGIHVEVASSEDIPDAIDLTWDPCIVYDEDMIYLDSGNLSYGALWAEGTEFDAQSCFDEVEDFPLPLRKDIDPVAPAQTWFTEGDVLCMQTSSQQIALGEVTVIEPSTADNPGLQVTLEVSLWARE